jgi:hypothetical protein
VSPPDVDAAVRFLASNGRVLDRRRYERLFLGGAARPVRDAVAAYRNPDGGFGHYPGWTSDADAVYFQVGTLVMAGFLKPAEPLPKDPHLLSWGHLFPVAETGPKH